MPETVRVVTRDGRVSMLHPVYLGAGSVVGYVAGAPPRRVTFVAAEIAALEARRFDLQLTVPRTLLGAILTVVAAWVAIMIMMAGIDPSYT